MNTNLEIEAIETLKDMDGIMCIEDYDVQYQGALVTHAILTSDTPDMTELVVQFWSGDPEEDHSAEILVDDQTRKHLYELMTLPF